MHPAQQELLLPHAAPHPGCRSYRGRAVREALWVLAEFGTDIDADRRSRVHDSTAHMRHMILPMRPAGREGISEEALAGFVTRDSFIGVTVPRAG